MGHENKCGHLHGHNYVVLARAEVRPEYGHVMDGIGRVIDFSVLKERLGGWIDKQWDHGFILHRDDTAGQRAMTAMSQAMPEPWSQKIFLMEQNPTAENMARLLLLEVGPEVFADTAVHLTHVRVWETENCYADADLYVRSGS